MTGRLRFYGVILTVCFILHFLPDFQDSLNKNQVEKGITNWMLTRKHGEGIHMIIERKGDDAGKIGYFYVELQSKECVIVPMDARLGIKMAGKKNYLDYYTSAAYRGTLPKFDSDVWLRLNTLINLIINRKSESQKWWAYYLNM